MFQMFRSFIGGVKYFKCFIICPPPTGQAWWCRVGLLRKVWVCIPHISENITIITRCALTTWQRNPGERLQSSPCRWDDDWVPPGQSSSSFYNIFKPLKYCQAWIPLKVRWRPSSGECQYQEALLYVWVRLGWGSLKGDLKKNLAFC